MIGNDEFNNIRAELSGQDPVIKRIKLANLKFHESSIARDVILIGGHEVPVLRSFFTRLAQVVGLNVSLLNRMEKNADNTIQQKLLEALKSYVETRDGDKDFFLIGDPDKHKIVNIVLADKYNRLTNETLFQTTEMLLNEIPGLQINSIDRPGNGNLSINLVHVNDAGLESLGKDEVFRFGISLVNNPNRSDIQEYVERLSCSNGMRTRMTTDDGPKGPKLGGGGLVGPEGFRDIINQAHIWARDGFMPATFTDRLERAMKTEASMGELVRACNSVQNRIQEEDPDRKFKLLMAAKAEFFPHLEATERRLVNKGYDPKRLLPEEMKFIRTGMTIWDVVNNFTWLGSHKALYDFYNPSSFKVEGGKLFADKWHLEHSELANV